jgi:hypothetical protein
VNLQVHLSRRETLRILDVCLLGIWAVCILGAAFAGLGALLATRADQSNRFAARRLEADLVTARREIAEASKISRPNLPRGLSSISQFQNQTQVVASRWSCALAEFQSAVLTQPYLNKYSNAQPKSDWIEMEVQMTLKGSAGNLVSALREVCSSSIPVELDKIELKRLTTDRNGQTTVAATAKLRVVTLP